MWPFVPQERIAFTAARQPVSTATMLVSTICRQCSTLPPMIVPGYSETALFTCVQTAGVAHRLAN